MTDSAGIRPEGATSKGQERCDPTRSSLGSPEREQVWWVLQTGFADAAWNMAVDEWLLNTASQRPPVLRLYGWKYPSLSLGRHEPWRRKVDLDRVQDLGVRMVRRITGGRVVFHHRELTYSVTAPRGMYKSFDEGLEGTLRNISLALVRGLQQLGVASSFRRRRAAGNVDGGFCFGSVSRYELVSEGRKVVGSAQYRSPAGFLQHGSIPAFNTLADLRALGPARRREEPQVRGRDEPSPWCSESWDSLGAAIAAGFQSEFGWKARSMAAGAVDRGAVAGLCRGRYASPEWTFRR